MNLDLARQLAAVDWARLALLVCALASAYFAGYQRGRLVEFREREEP